jgi:NADPH:quinone reductase-like Zn-dependent oxidoreductase
MTIRPNTMTAAVLTGFGGLDKLEVRHDVPVPQVGPSDVLIRVGACGINNTDINTRAGWYNASVRVGTTTEGGLTGFDLKENEQSGGGGSGEGVNFEFPRIQGADVAGSIIDVGTTVSKDRIGERVLIDPLIRPIGVSQTQKKNRYLGNGIDGGFAEFCCVPSINAISVETDMSTEELATFPCSSSTAELLMVKGGISSEDVVIITGASGGVGSAAVQLAKRRGAFVIAITTEEKSEFVQKLGPDTILSRDTEGLVKAVRDSSPNNGIDVVVDVVGGDNFKLWIECLRPGGRYLTSGAIAGPIVELDLRLLYLKDLALIGATELPATVFENLIKYIENEEIQPALSAVFTLDEIHDAQRAFLEKKHCGNIVVVPSQRQI